LESDEEAHHETPALADVLELRGNGDGAASLRTDDPPRVNPPAPDDQAPPDDGSAPGQ
jgi:hypothetical protein